MADRTSVLYLGSRRCDVVRRGGTARVLSDADLARSATRALDAGGAPEPSSVTIVLTDDAELHDLNLAHLGHDEPTDVLSFPMLAPETFRGQSVPASNAGRARTHIGDIAISVERAIQQADAGHGGQTGDVGWSPADELRLLVTHGVLHLCGWDHAEPAAEAAMRALERRLLDLASR